MSIHTRMGFSVRHRGVQLVDDRARVWRSERAGGTISTPTGRIEDGRPKRDALDALDLLHRRGGTRTPPARQIARQRNPCVGIGDCVQQLAVVRLILGQPDVASRRIGMGQHARHAIRVSDALQVAEPLLCIGLPEQTEQGVVLRQGDGQFDQVVDEVREERRTPPWLRLKGGGVGDRGVVLEFEQMEPIPVPIRGGRPKARSTPPATTLVDGTSRSKKVRQLENIRPSCV